MKTTWFALIVILGTASHAVCEDANDQDLTKVLNQWRDTSNQIRTFNALATFTRYDQVFGTVEKGVGRILWQAPRLGRIDVQPIELNSTPKHISKFGREFRVKPMSQSSWVWTATEFSISTSPSERIWIPRTSSWLAGISEFKSCVPFLTGAGDDEFEQFTFQLRQNPNGFELVCKPIKPPVTQNDGSFRVLIDSKLWRTTATEVCSVGGNSIQTVVLTDIKINTELPRGWFLHHSAEIPR